MSTADRVSFAEEENEAGPSEPLMDVDREPAAGDMGDEGDYEMALYDHEEGEEEAFMDQERGEGEGRVEETFRLRLKVDAQGGINAAIVTAAEMRDIEEQTDAALHFLEDLWAAEEAYEDSLQDEGQAPGGRTGTLAGSALLSSPSQPAASTSGRPPLGVSARNNKTGGSRLVERVRSSRKVAADVDAALIKQQVAAATVDLRSKTEAQRDLEEQLATQQALNRTVEARQSALRAQLTALLARTVPPREEVRQLERRLGDVQSQREDGVTKEKQIEERLLYAGLALREVESTLAQLQLESVALEPLAEAAKEERDRMMEELHRKEMAGANQMVARRAQELGRIHEQIMDEEERRLDQVRAARRARQQAIGRLRHELDRIKKDVIEANQDDRNYIQARLRVLTNLRKHILSAQEDMKRRSAARERKAAEKRKQHQSEFESLLQEGQNPYTVFRQRDINTRAEHRRRDLAEQIRKSEMEIAARLLKEEDKYKRRMRAKDREEAFMEAFRREMGNQAQEERMKEWMTTHTRDQTELLDPTSRRPWFPSEVTDIKTWAFGLGDAEYKTLVKVAQNPKRPELYDAKLMNVMVPRRYLTAMKREEQEAAGEILKEERGGLHDVDEEDDDTDFRVLALAPADALNATIVAEPEFRGTWEASKEVALGPKRYEPKLSVAEKRKMAEAHERHKSNIAVKQVVMGREFKGAAFEPSPKVVQFKDFEVGKSYSQSVVLTNISWTKCSLRLLDLPVDVRTSLSVKYTPSGQLSAGMTTTMTIVFEPKVNQDVRTRIPMLATTGPLFIPVECTTKKAEIKLSVRELDFSARGQPVTLGESAVKSVFVINNGALPVEFEIEPTIVNAAHERSPDGTRSDDFDEDDDEDEDEDDFGMERGPGAENDGVTPEVSQRLLLPANSLPASKPRTRGGAAGAAEPAAAAAPEEGSKAELATSTPLKIVAQTESHLWPELHHAGFEIAPEHRSGTVSGYSKREVKIRFNPRYLGQVGAALRVRFYTKGGAKGAAPIPDLLLPLKAIGGDIPCIVESDLIDLKCCVIGQSYAQELKVVNRGRAAMKATVMIPPQFSEYVTISPETGFVQGSSAMGFRLTFRPLSSMLERVGKRVKRVDGSSADFEITMPLKVKVLDQTLPLPCTLKATVTNSTLQFSPAALDFGLIPTGEFAAMTIKVSNVSRLPVKFGFQRQTKNGLIFKPNAGFGSLLPGESREVEACFNPPTTGPHHFDIDCRTLLGRTFSIPLRAVAFRPSLYFSANRVVIRSTEIGTTNTESLFLRNSSDQEQSFHFVLPKGCEDLMVTPQVGTLPPHSSIRVQLNFLPQAGEDTPPKEEWDPSLANSFLSKSNVNLDDVAEGEDEELEEVEQRPSQSNNPRGGVAFDVPSRPSTPELPQLVTWCRRREWLIPCYIRTRLQHGEAAAAASSATAERSTASQSGGGGGTFRGDPGTLVSQASMGRGALSSRSLAPQANLDLGEEKAALTSTVGGPAEAESAAAVVQKVHLQVSTTAVIPRIMLQGKGLTWHPQRGYYQLHFGQIPLGQRVLLTVSMRNNTADEHSIVASPLDPNGPFQLLNPFKTLEPFSGHKVLLEFKPIDEGPATDVLQLKTESSCVRLRVMGEGVSPDLEVDCAEVDCGDVLKGTRVLQSFTVTNHGQFPIRMVLFLRSLLVREAHVPPKEEEGLPDFRMNMNGSSPFLIKPSEAMLAPGAQTTVEVAFCPDHQHMFEDLLDITVPNQPEKLTLKLWGRGWDRGMYVLGLDKPQAVVDPTMSAKLKVAVATAVSSEPPRRLTLAPEKIEGGKTAQGTVVIGNIAGTGAASGEYSFSEIPAWARERGWAIENPKGHVAPGTRQAVKFRFTAPSIPTPNSLAYYGMGEWVQLPLSCMVKGGNPPQPGQGTEIKMTIRVFVVASAETRKL